MTAKNNSNLYSKLSLGSSVLCLVVFAFSIAMFPDSIKVGEENLHLMYYAGILVFVFALVGCILIIVSFSNNEPSGWIKWTAAVISSLMLILILGSVIFSNIMDATR